MFKKCDHGELDAEGRKDWMEEGRSYGILSTVYLYSS
jgi:hypothetical protein